LSSIVFKISKIILIPFANLVLFPILLRECVYKNAYYERKKYNSWGHWGDSGV
jgi:hypothetical protein